MAQILRQFLDGPFGQVHFRTAKPNAVTSTLPLICLHQSPKSSREFINFMQVMGDTRHVIAIDNPGHGESDVPAQEQDATIPNYAKSAWAIISALGFDKVDLLGHHTGAKVATEMTWQRPSHVRAIVMVSALVLTAEEQAGFEAQFQPIPIDEAGTRFSEMWAKSVKHRGPGVSLVDLADSFAENLRAGEAYEWGHKAAFAYNALFPDRVKTLSNPITVLNPADMLFELTPRVKPLLQNGNVIDHPEWGFGFMDAYTQDAVAAVEDALTAS